MSDINQDDIDKLLESAQAGGDEPASAADPAPPEEERGPASQDDIDALFAAVENDADPAPPPPLAPEAAEPAPAAASAEPPPDPAASDLDGIANQDDIDALFAAVGDENPPEPAPEPAAAPDDADLDGIANQDDIDALFSSLGGEPETAPAPKAPEPTPAPEPEPVAEPQAAPAAEDAPREEAAEADLGGVANQDDIDALFSSVGDGAVPGPEPESDLLPEVVEEPADHEDTGGPAGQDDIAAMFDSQLAEMDAADQAEEAGKDDDLDELLTSIADESAATESRPSSGTAKDETVAVDVDMDELLRQVSEAAPPPPPDKPKQEKPDYAGDTAILNAHSPEINGILDELEQVKNTLPPQPEPGPPAATPAPVPAAVPPPAVPPPPPSGGGRREYSVLYGAGEVESMANQIAALIAAMSKKAHGYMQAWIAADSEAKDLRTRALDEERRRSSLEAERNATVKQLEDLRKRLGELEGGKVASEEATRTLETTYQAKIRELDNRSQLLASEVESLKDELVHARNEATGVDLESRRNRFEVDRLKNEVESERMERLRIQRALENREKEIQALQSQSAGQASSLFIDELHRLVRRLESELDARTSGASEALKQLDRLETSEDMVPVVANLRAALMQAVGADDSQDDAIKSLGREASGVQGPAAIAPGKAEVVSFETALATYNLSAAVDVAGTLLREARTTTGLLMKKIYQCPALRRPEVTPYLDDLARLLDGLRTVQEAADRSRGRETGESEVFYVHMFDFLHNLVRLKLVNRLSGEIWRLFLDLRGRFSFVTSDKQWAEYRDNTLNDKKTRG